MIQGAPPQGETRAAQHCEELLSNTLESADVARDFARFGTRLQRALQPRLAKLFDARKLDTELAECTEFSALKLEQSLGQRMHHARLALPCKGLGIIASMQVSAMIGELDRMLGGDGEGPAEASVLPASANRFARQVEAELLAACIEASGRGDLAAAGRGSDLAEIVPAASRAPIRTASIAVLRPGAPKLVIKFSVCDATFVQFASRAPVGDPVRRTIGEVPIASSALAGVELSATATLVDMPVPLNRIVALRIGTMLPVSIHRSVPLSIADTTIAHGAVGAIEDRVALEIHHTAIARNI